MKTARSSRFAPLFLLVTLGLPVAGRCQTYYVSTPITGRMTLGARDSTTRTSAHIDLLFTNLAETVYLDTAAMTIRQVGFISVTPLSATVTIQETQYVGGVFPNPPVSTPGTVVVTSTPDGGGLYFDTGPRSLTLNTVGGYYDISAPIVAGVPCSGSYTLITGGFTNTAAFSHVLTSLGYLNSGVWTFSTLSVPDYPASLSLNGLGNSSPDGVMGSDTLLVADVTAPDGFHLQLNPTTSNPYFGLKGAEAWRWSSGSVTATLTTTSPPSITAQPQSVGTHAHDQVSFNVTATGLLPMYYQWSLNGTNLAGATASNLTISNASQWDLGTYAVVITNGFGSTNSSSAILSMYPSIEAPFTGAVTYWGKPAAFSIVAWGSSPMSCQWFKDGVAVLDATNQVLRLSYMQFTNAGLYSVVVTNSLGSATNTPAQVIVNPAGVSLGLYPGVTIDGVVGYNYVIQRSPDLRNTNAWVTMTNLTLVQPVQLWVDTNVDASLPAHPLQFYRVLPGQ